MSTKHFTEKKEEQKGWTWRRRSHHESWAQRASSDPVVDCSTTFILAQPIGTQADMQVEFNMWLNLGNGNLNSNMLKRIW